MGKACNVSLKKHLMTENKEMLVPEEVLINLSGIFRIRLIERRYFITGSYLWFMNLFNMNKAGQITVISSIAKTFTLCLALILFGCSLPRNEYDLYVIIHKDCKVNQASRVLWEGKEIGSVRKVTVKDPNTVILDLSIQDQIKLPASSSVECHENILGDIFINISSPSKVVSNDISYIHSMDTLLGRVIYQFHKLDSNDKKKIINKLEDLKKTLDTFVRDSISR